MDTTILRLSLLFVAVLVIVAVYVWTKSMAEAQYYADSYPDNRDNDNRDNEIEQIEEEYDNDVEEKDDDNSQLLIFRLQAIGSVHITGEQLLTIKENYKLSYDNKNMFLVKKNQGKLLYTICSSYNPGTIPHDIEQFSASELSAFMSFAKNESKNEFELFIADLQTMAVDLNATLLDEDRNRVSQQTLNYVREHII
ncbi:MAG: hypothetical protein DRQ51_07935 [Gammaproteobacteria bacterium]|nr:MAG: hypothetical protein DRQ51_07935 [Gammaproteobacteria bacterium]